MAVPNITINKIDGSILQPQATVDGISALVFYDSSLDNNIYEFFEYKDADDVFAYANGTNGIDSIINYHIKEYFKFSKSKLYVKTINTNDSFACVDELIMYSNRSIKLISVYDNINLLDTSKVTSLSTAIDTAGAARKSPIAGVSYQAKLPSNVEALTDLKELTAKNVGVLLAQDLTTDSIGKELFDINGTNSLVGCVGTVLGLVAKQSVVDLAAQTLNNVNVDGQFSSIGFTDSSTYISKSQTFIDQLHDYRYQFLLKHAGISGSYLNLDWTATENSDYRFIARNRIYNKAYDVIYATLIRSLNKKLLTTNGGDLDTIEKETIKTLVGTQLDNMVLNGEISGYDILIPTQNVITTNTVKITVKVRPHAYANYYVIDFTYTI